MRISDEEMLAPTDIPFDKVPPYRVKVVEYTEPTTRSQRKELIKEGSIRPAISLRSMSM